MAMRAAQQSSTTTSSPGVAGAPGQMAAMTDVGSAMDMSDLDGKEIGNNAGEKLAVFNKVSGWPELKEAVMSRGIQTACLPAPIVKDLAHHGVTGKSTPLRSPPGPV